MAPRQHHHDEFESNQFLGKELKYFSQAGFDLDRIHIKRNAPVASLYEDAILNEGAVISSNGALINFSGKKTGRSPKDKRIVFEETSKDDVWWGPVNIKMDEHTFEINRERAIDYLNTRENVYVFDGFAGWDPKYRIKVRVIASRAYHALFMHNMLIRPTPEELENFGEPDFIIYNAGQFPANRFTTGMTSTTSVGVNFKRMEMVILGTEYAGEMKKGIFSVMHYLQPVKFGQLSLHSSANQGIGENDDVTLFFGLSGTGKTTLSADANRLLIGDDEHVWSDTGVFNIEGGCYAKCINLSAEKEPEIFNAIKFGSILENVVYNPADRKPDYDDVSITENTRCAYPIEYIPNAKIPCIADRQPSNIIMLCCDAFGVLPPVSRLTPEQAQYHFVAGYTSKTPGTEDGIVEPSPTFSTCYGQPFIILHPGRYAKMLAERMEKNRVNCWLINTGWTGGKFGTGKRCPLKYTRAIVDAIHNGSLAEAEYENFPIFNLAIPKAVEGVPSEILNPEKVWPSKEAFKAELDKLGGMFQKAFAKYEADIDEKVKLSGPVFA
ncbi:phosphoenolpyruvate carboxykinase (ATP) [Cryptococcus neoformans C23]|uniref:Phosphoenolpyruvate carboxykinase (ATP) n=1 Tax=Cryptococcus neoformans (strain H99 / ATCC 208821 / CBS 10515 / FGSC 9487) TaxID=235443 RepID=J9VWI4_CRYN9|nr:phosphoenolpyruvate carboxykinase (ATP) [Cryptococcus neoformans var. grubii H99]AUB26918.1 phosphoenolpyruvate carboxykinase (ATP) [Cryptococcus neoformans var. grubii]OWT37377.1 phosphoenolpyruvate carboxykinase (ATP) [Cryptococcus neoformans var. grubii Bt1]OWZ29255.1 phosphoenolpyruvate carboxykinase (ATP) [Cryptococcus neoformans var. grubii AD2-60a]OWZ35795.1 phosphoenolpyruvate carboxykinase (ATP) [Cryptococcus neoformans var. grubii AD1-83a]OWZ41121.1 phosphoenolpyruvate carboxykina|eukprot:XP_012051670.1 phosphoenolpyruvate carboxykinase (ATP) [Cryptococcus neoformans var. grubii H99]